ncbi:MAG: hypothetical protein K5865_08190 [Eubacterium sp.]|nr:hypothetical protein [Eubacterium sp.]
MVVKKRVSIVALCVCVPFILSSCKSDDKQELSSTSATEAVIETEAATDKNVDNTGETEDLASTADESQSDLTETKNDEGKVDPVGIVITYDIDQGSFYYDKDLYYNGLVMTNIKTGDRRYACDVPGCLHEPNSRDCTVIEETPWPDFSAVCGNKISYYNLDKKEVRMINTDGSDIRTLAEVSDYDNMSEKGKVLVGSHLYCLFELENVSVDENGICSVTSGVTRLYDLDFDSEKLSVIYESDKAIKSQALYICYCDEKLYFSYEDQTKTFEESGLTQQEYYTEFDKYFDKRYEIQGLVDHNIILDLGSGEIRDVEWKDPEGEYTVSPTCFINNTLYYYGDNGIYSYDLENDEQKTVCSDTYYNYVYQSADFILLRWSKTADNSDGFEYAIIENGDDNLKKLKNAETDDFFITDECYAQLKVQYYDAGTDSAFDSKRVKYMDREEFKNMFV